ncbi:MAG: hypothetical protein PHN19_06005 [Patescibacteria group bacterium]|nr:hypothetical protein [Patescibacteria group bacterium]
MPVNKKSSKKKKTSIDSKQSKQLEDLKSQVDYFKNQIVSSSNAQLERNVNELNEQLVKLVSININLQSKMTELLIKMTDLVRENRELISLLEESSEESSAENVGLSNENLVFELKKIEKNTSDTMKSNQELGQYLKKMYTKNLLSKAIGEKMNQMPMPENDEEGMNTIDL